MASGQEVETTIEWADGMAESVAIRGTFSRDSRQWWTESIPLRREASGYKVVLALEPGRYEFKYVVNGGDWRVNSSAYQIVDDGHGNSNNVIIVAPANSQAESGSTDTALSVDKQPLEPGDMQRTYVSEHTRLLLDTRSGETKSVAGYSGIQGSIHDDEDRSSHTADGGDDGDLAGAAESGSGGDGRTWHARRAVVGALALLIFGLLGAAGVLWYG
ncbi:hypothetical protein IW152_004427 [Coemansia sp. BCRC 34962]|nr:hypothetical protein IW152_004427 [Coemansia sp. BCRC 34962]